MKLILSLILIMLSASTGAQINRSTFLPENGRFEYKLPQILENFWKSGIKYVELREGSKGTSYKHDRRRNEYQIKDWFLQDWFQLQDLWTFDEMAFIRGQKAQSFNEAKIWQYRKFSFDKDEFFHYKTPSMKEWSGLTHPPVKRLSLALEKYDARFSAIDYKTVESPFFNTAFQVSVDNASDSELSFGNQVTVLADHFAFEKKKALIRKAKEAILMSSLVFVCDRSTQSLVNLLVEKHRAGVDVKILVDGMVSKALLETKCLKIMAEAGIEVLRSKDFFRHKLKAIYHSKTLIVDFTEAIAGGHNMIDADNSSRGLDFKNRVLDLYVKGPLVTDMARRFVENWRYQASLRKNTAPLTAFEARVSELLKQER